MTHLEKNISEMKEEIAALNLEIKRLKTQTRLENARARSRVASGKASLSLAKAKHERRKAKLSGIKSRALARTYTARASISRGRKEARRIGRFF